MTDEILLVDDFSHCARRWRRGALSDIFDGLPTEEEKLSLLQSLEEIYSYSSSLLASNENGDLASSTSSTATDTASTSTTNCSCSQGSPSEDQEDQDSPCEGCSQLVQTESERRRSTLLSTLETARPSCLVGLKASSSSSSSSSQQSSCSGSSSPSSMSSQTNSMASSSSSSSSDPTESATCTEPATATSVQSAHPDDPSGSTHGLTSSSPTSPSSSSSSSKCYSNISFSRVRRNALHDLLETLSPNDIEKLKSLYQSSLATAYSLKHFSEQSPGSIRGLPECKA